MIRKIAAIAAVAISVISLGFSILTLAKVREGAALQEKYRNLVQQEQSLRGAGERAPIYPEGSVQLDLVRARWSTYSDGHASIFVNDEGEETFVEIWSRGTSYIMVSQGQIIAFGQQLFDTRYAYCTVHGSGSGLTEMELAANMFRSRGVDKLKESVKITGNAGALTYVCK